MTSSHILESLRQAVIVSVQAEYGEPLSKPECILAMAMSTLNGGAKGLRLANPENIRLVKESLPEIPVIGITKPVHPYSDPENHVYITPSLWTAESVLQAGAEIVAMDATLRPRPTEESLKEIVLELKKRFPTALLMADIATEEEANVAVEMGFDVISTTLSGYTAETVSKTLSGEPDFSLLAALSQNISRPVILEGRIWTPEHVTKAFDLGAYAVIIGSAITRPQVITKRFVHAIPSLKA